MPYDRLTGREKEVLQHIAGGKTSKQVAEALSVSIHTISNHRKHICRKLGLHSTAELVAFAARQMLPQEKAEAAGS
jgi:two-component system, NarL family, response regulator NreC